jgi:hypothetical protein
MFLLLPIDMINGFLLHNNIVLPISVSQLLKIIILFLITFSFIWQPKNIIISFICFFVLILPSLIQSIFQLDFSFLFFDAMKVAKYLTPLIAFLFFANVFKKSNYKINLLILKLVKFSYSILIVNIFVKYVGLGYPMYISGDIGSKGFFFAGNEISVLLIVLSSVIAIDIWKKQNKKQYFFFFILTLLAGLTISSKTGIVGTLIVFFLIPFKRISFKIKRKNLNYLLIFAGVILPVTALFVRSFIQNSKIYTRFSFFWNKLDFFTFIFSNRNNFFLDSYMVFTKEYAFFEKLFGVGQKRFEILNKGKAVEIDIADIFFSYGIIGLSLFVVLLTFLFVRLKIIDKELYIYSPFINLMLIFLLCISVTAGHVFGSGMAGIFIGLLFSLMFVKQSAEYEPF